MPAANLTAMGYSVRTADWRFTEWYAWDGSRCVARFGESIGIELYDHRAAGVGTALDFDATENENVAQDSAHADVVAALRSKLRARFDTGAALGCPPEPPKEHNHAALEDGAGIAEVRSRLEPMKLMATTNIGARSRDM